MRLGLLFVSTVAALLSVQIAKTQPIETVEVIGVTSLGGTVDLDRVASNVQVATSEDIRRRRAVSLAEFRLKLKTDLPIRERVRSFLPVLFPARD